MQNVSISRILEGVDITCQQILEAALSHSCLCEARKTSSFASNSRVATFYFAGVYGRVSSIEYT